MTNASPQTKYAVLMADGSETEWTATRGELTAVMSGTAWIEDQHDHLINPAFVVKIVPE